MLTRKENEKIVIGNDVIVTVVQVSPTKVRLAIQAPRDVPVLRDEMEPGCVEAVEQNIAARDLENGHQPRPGVTYRG